MGLNGRTSHRPTTVKRRRLDEQQNDCQERQRTPKSAKRAALCRRAGGGLFHDRLNFARDTDALTDDWCATRSGVVVLDHTPDPDIDAILAQRGDICP